MRRMGILREPGERDELHQLRSGEIYLPRKDRREAVKTLGRGSLACPSCDVPVVMADPIGIAARMRCPFCRRIHPARGFLRLDRTDTALNDVRVTARIEPYRQPSG
jgi:Zn-finger nucleic acid-binding protein